MTIQELEKKAAEYVLILEGEEKDEWWCTPRSLATGQIRLFLEWLQANTGAEHE